MEISFTRGEITLFYVCMCMCICIFPAKKEGGISDILGGYL
jgi:hypothetical protein